MEGKPALLNPTYFSVNQDGSKVNFREEYYLPFLKRFAIAIREANPDLIFLFEPVPNEDPPMIDQTEDWHSNCVYSPHWYDLDSGKEFAYCSISQKILWIYDT